MLTALSILFRTGLSVGLVISCAIIISIVYDNRPSVQRLDVRSDQGWTSVPVRIDPSSQAYERLPVPPDPLPLKFRAGSNVRTIDSASFELDGKRYRLEGARMIDRTKICTDKSGHRYSCGLRAFKALDNILRGAFVECAVVDSQHHLEFVKCSTNGQDVAQRLQRLPSD